MQAYATLDRLLLEADRLDKPLELDAEALRKADIQANKLSQDRGLAFDLTEDEQGRDHPIELVGNDLAVPTVPRSSLAAFLPDSLAEWLQTVYDPYVHIYAKYEVPGKFPPGSPQRVARQKLFLKKPSTGSVLGTNDALNLLLNIVEGPEDTSAGLNVGKLMSSEKKLKAMFPGHCVAERNRLYNSWSHWAVMPWAQPLDDIRAYLGERIAMYFGFLGYLAASLLVPGVVGAVVFVNQVLSDEPHLEWLPAYALVVIAWATFLMIGWKKKQFALSMRWGTTEFARTQARRPEYLESRAVKRHRSFVSGKQEYWADPLWQRVRRGTSASIVSLAVGTVIVVILSLFTARVFLEREEREGNLDEGWGGYLASFLTAVQIQVR